jgi:hypothetical protein
LMETGDMYIPGHAEEFCRHPILTALLGANSAYCQE